MRSLLSTANWLQTILRYPLQDQPGRNLLLFLRQFSPDELPAGTVPGQRAAAICRGTALPTAGHSRYFLGVCDPQGVPFGGSDLYLHPEDMLKIGILCQQHGKWQGAANHPAAVAGCCHPPVVKVDEADRYGYGWWVDHNVEQGCLPSYSACGVEGNASSSFPIKNASWSARR
jgi:hypothetical protein